MANNGNMINTLNFSIISLSTHDDESKTDLSTSTVPVSVLYGLPINTSNISASSHNQLHHCSTAAGSFEPETDGTQD